MKLFFHCKCRKNNTDIAGSKEPKAFTLRPKILTDRTMPIHCRYRHITYTHIIIHIYIYIYTVCPTRYQTRHFFNNSDTNEDIATKFEQEYVRCVRNEKECVCSAPSCCYTEQRSASNILISGKIIKEMPGLVASGTLYIYTVKPA